MGKLGMSVASMIFGCLVFAPGAMAAIEVPGLPPIDVPETPALPAPPATVGRCLVATQGLANGVSTVVDGARLVVLTTLTRQEAEAVELLVGVARISPEAGNIAPFYVAILENTGATSADLIAPAVQATSVLAPTTNGTVGSASAMVLVWLPAAGDEATLLAPWAGERFDAFMEPIMAWNRATTLTLLLANPGNHVLFFAGLAMNEGGRSVPPMAPLASAVTGTLDDANRMLNGQGGLGNGVNSFVDGTAAAAGDGVERYGAAVGLLMPNEPGSDPVLPSRFDIESMAERAKSDAYGSVNILNARAAAAASAASAFLHEAPGCIR